MTTLTGSPMTAPSTPPRSTDSQSSDPPPAPIKPVPHQDKRGFDEELARARRILVFPTTTIYLTPFNQRPTQDLNPAPGAKRPSVDPEENKTLRALGDIRKRSRIESGTAA